MGAHQFSNPKDSLYGERELNLLNIFFDRTPMGIVVVDREFKLIRFNPTWTSFIERYTPSTANQVVPGAKLFELAPGIEETVLPILQLVLEGKTVRRENVRLESGGKVSYWDLALTPLVEEDQIAGIVGMLADATERALAHQTLEQRVEERTRELTQRMQELETLYEADEQIDRHVHLDELLQVLVDVALEALKADKASLLIWDAQREAMAVRAHRGFSKKTVSKMRFTAGEGIVGRVAESGKPMIVEDALTDARVATYITEPEKIRSFIHAPIKIKKEVYGVFNVNFTRPHSFTETDKRLVEALAKRAGLAIENAQLLEQVKRRANVAEALREVLTLLNSDRSLDEVLHYIAKQASFLLKADAAAIYRLYPEEKVLRIEVQQGLPPEYVEHMQVGVGQLAVGRSVLSREPVAVPNIEVLFTTPPELISPEDVMPPKQQKLLKNLVERFKGLLAVPLIVKDEAYGTIALYYREPQAFFDEDIELAVTIGDYAALALENARLHEQVERRATVAEGLRDIMTILNSEKELDEALDYIVTQASDLLGTKAVSIYRIEVRDGIIHTVTSRGLERDYVAEMKIPLGGGMVGQTIMQGKPMVVPDSSVLLPNALEQMPDPEQQQLLKNLFDKYRAILAAPLIIKDQVYGGISLYYPERRSFSDEEIEIALTIADQAALAIENARLQASVEETAVAAERSRLARELHDAVTQTLFSASVIAEVLPTLWRKDRKEGERRLEELRQLTRGALAEMRTLLLELRPSTLVETELGELLRQLADATTGTARIPVNVTVEGRRPLPPDVQIALYRIAQEALNNIARHSGAKQAELSLRLEPNKVELRISDNGHGFETENTSPQSLGMGIMRERAEAIGAALKIESQISHGTQTTVTWCEEQQKE